MARSRNGRIKAGGSVGGSLRISPSCPSYWQGIRAVSTIGPADRSVKPVLTRIVPTHAMIAERASRRPYRECYFVRANRIAGISPHLPTRMHCWERINRHVQDVRDFRRSLLAVDLIGDLHLFRSEILADEWRDGRYRPTRGAGEDRAERLGLFVVCAFIDVSADRPIAFRHWPGSMDHERHVEAVKCQAA